MNTFIRYLPEWGTLAGAAAAYLIPYSIYKLFIWLSQDDWRGQRWRGLVRSNTSSRLVMTTCRQDDRHKEQPQTVLGSGLSDNLELFCDRFGHNGDFRIRRFQIHDTDIYAGIVFFDGICDKDFIKENIIKPLMKHSALARFILDRGSAEPIMIDEDVKQYIRNSVLYVTVLGDSHSMEEAVDTALTGSTILFIDCISGCFILPAPVSNRTIQEPISEALVRGPRVGFVESLRENTALLRNRAPDPNLSIIEYIIGRRNPKTVALAYVQDIIDPSILEEVRRRVEQIDIDDLPESGYLEQLIEDNYLSPFPQIQATERVDRVVASLLEGRIALLLDGTPFALIVPATFNMFLQSPEDYYVRWFPGSFIRILRYFAAIVTMFGPSIYIAFVSFHHGLIPTKLVISMAGTREGVPFPPLVEALLMEFAIELLREAGLRLPRPVGQTVGLVGGLIIGQAAVEAKIISPFMVIVVSLTAITSFVMPHYSISFALRLLRFVAMFCASFLGLYGVIMFALIIFIHFVKLKSFGVPYIAPAAPIRLGDLKDFLIRMPLLLMKRRPEMLHPNDTVRQRDRNKEKEGDNR